MLRTALALGLGILIVLPLLFAGCNADCTCKDYDPETDEATYCRNHREAVWDYVELGSGTDEIRTQVGNMERLLEVISKCRDTSCINAEIRTENHAPGFADVFTRWNQRAEQDVGGAELKRWKVILCGLNNGWNDWQDSLKIMEGQQ